MFQALVINQDEEKKLEITKEQLKRKDAEEIPESLLRGEFSEEESARSFQEALRQWREEKSGATGELTTESAMWIPARPGELPRHGCKHKETLLHTE